MNARLGIDVLKDDANIFDEDEFGWWLIPAPVAVVDDVEWTLLVRLLIADNLEFVVVDKLDDVQIFITKNWNKSIKVKLKIIIITEYYKTYLAD